MTDLIKEGGRTSIPTKASRVTFFEDRAEVSRSAKVQVAKGAHWVSLAGVSVAVDDASVVARARGEEVRTLGSRVLRKIREEPAESPDRIAQLEEELRRAQREHNSLLQNLEVCRAQVTRLGRMREEINAASSRPQRGEDPWSSMRNAREQVGRELTKALDEESALIGAIDEADRVEEQVKSRLALALSVKRRQEAEVEVQVESASDQEIELELVYRVPCALWRAEHLFRLENSGEKSQLSVKTYATVWQRTGEEWSEVACRFSTARPAQAASAPLLGEDVVASRKKTEQEKRRVVVQAREQAIQTSGLDRGTRTLDDMPGMDDGGEPLWFESKQPVTLPGDGRAFRVLIGEWSGPCKADWISYPEKSPAVHVRATATWTGSYPLLAGPAWMARGGEIVGRAKAAFVACGEPFEIGIGVDDTLRVRRTQSETRETTMVIGTQKVTKEATVFVSNLANEPKRLKVRERFPVSEVSAVEIAVLSAEGARQDTKDGFADFDVELSPNGTATVSLKYRIEAESKVVLP